MDRNPRLAGGMCRPTNQSIGDPSNTARAGEIAARRSSESHLIAVRSRHGGWKRDGICSAEMASPERTTTAEFELLRPSF